MGTVGIIGLGIMGSAYAKNFIAGGVSIIGVDPSREARLRLESLGGTAHECVDPSLAACDIVVLALVSPAALREICGELAALLHPRQVVLETGTFSIADKTAARDTLAAKDIQLLDCPVSGTGAQAWHADILMMISGNAGAIATARPFLMHITKGVIEAGEFGMGSRLKYVANHAVAVHNAAAAETLSYSDALGLDRQVTFDMLSRGAGQSKMSDLRMPMMISGAYEPPTASLRMFEKDLAVIGDDIRRLGMTAPLFDAVDDLYKAALADLPPTHDTAAVFEVYRNHEDQSHRTTETESPKSRR